MRQQQASFRAEIEAYEGRHDTHISTRERNCGADARYETCAGVGARGGRRKANAAKRQEAIDGGDNSILVAQSNLATTYAKMGRVEQAVQMDQDVYYGCLRLFGEEHARTITAAICYANSLAGLERFEEAKALLNKALPVARRVLGESHHLTLRMQLNYVQSLYKDDAATLEDLREAVSTLEETDRIARRVLGGAHPVTKNIEHGLAEARSTLASFDAP